MICHKSFELGKLLPIWDTNCCVPRDEILDGSLAESELALNLSSIVKGIAKPPYDNPKSFFEATFLTQSMRSILEDVIGRLSGTKPDVNPIILLDVGFGGGKTHTLASLYYAAKSASISEVKSILGNAIPPSNTRIVALSGDEYGSEGVKRDKTQIKTIWGDIFYQLGVYERFQKLDQEYKLPSLDDLRDALQGPPVLILLDELPSYMKSVHDQEYLMDKAVQYTQRLVLAVAEKNNAVLTIAIAEDTYKLEATKTKDAIVSATSNAMAEAKAHIKRKQRIEVPIQKEDVVPILNRRLFKKINSDSAKNTAEAYHKMYSSLPVDDKMKRPSYKENIISSYPFHPELIDVLYHRLATLDRFQNTRGALRVLSYAVKRIWDKKEKDATLIHPFHIDLADDGIKNDLTQGIGESKLKNAVEGDIWKADGTARAQEIDEQSQIHWDAPLVRRACNTIFLFSLAAGKEGSKGIETEILTAISVTPVREDHYSSIRDTICDKILIDQPFQFIDKQGSRFVFVKEAPPIKVIDNLAKEIMQEESTRKIKQAVNDLFARDGPNWLVVETFQSEPADLIDEPSIRIAILNPNSFSLPQNRSLSKDIENFLKFKDNHGKKLREFTNSAFLLVASNDRLNPLHATASKIVAAEKVRNELVKFGIPEERKTDVEAYFTRQNEIMNDNVRAAFSNLVYYDRDGIKVQPITSSGYSKAKSGAEMLALQLKNMNRISLEPLDSAYYVMEYVWPKNSPNITVKNLFETFHQVPGLEIPASKELFTDMVKKGIDSDTWILKDVDKVFTHKKPPHLIRIDNDSELYIIQEANKLGLLEEKPITPSAMGGSSSGGGINVPLPKITSHSWSDSQIHALSSDLETFMKREHYDKIDWLKIQMSQKQVYLASIKNFLTKIEPDQNIKPILQVQLSRPRSPNFDLSFKIEKDDINTEEGRSILDMSWKIKGTEYVDISLELEWTDGENTEKVVQLLKSLGDGSTEPIVARMSAKMSKRSQDI